MASFDVRSLSALEILDSRGRPTLAVSITLGDGSMGDAGVPSGASTGTREAVELRDGDRTRFAGAGVQQAVGHVNGDIAGLLKGRSWSSLDEADRLAELPVGYTDVSEGLFAKLKRRLKRALLHQFLFLCRISGGNFADSETEE